MNEWFRQRRWSHLLDLIDNLPSNSRYREAYLNDPEAAEQIARDQLEREQAGTTDNADNSNLPLSEFGLSEQLLAQIIDLLQSLQATTISAAGGKPKKPKPFPRPVTAVDKAKKRLNKQAAHDVLSLFGVSFNN